jgi:DNA-binding transcriptional MerR regulator
VWVVLIGELSMRTGVSARAIRHYEDRGLLIPRRTSAGYRTYDEDALVTVHPIKAMFAAGLKADVVRRYLDCASGDDVDSIRLAICPRLQAQPDDIQDRLAAESAVLRAWQERLAQIVTGR